jgi:hypothetical protein
MYTTQEGSLVTKSTVCSGGGEDFSMYREVQDLFYDVTFFCRCMSDAFLSDEQGEGGQANIASSSILDSSPSLVEFSSDGEIVHTTKRITSALKPNPQYSPPRRKAATVTAVLDSPERFHSGNDDDEGGSGSRGGGTPASSPSNQSHRSSSTGGTYSYITYNDDDNDDDDDSTDASSCRTSLSMYS